MTESDNSNVPAEEEKGWDVKGDRSLGVREERASTSEDEGTRLLNSSGGTEYKVDAKPKRLPGSCSKLWAGTWAERREDSTDGAQLSEVARFWSVVASDEGVWSAMTEEE